MAEHAPKSPMTTEQSIMRGMGLDENNLERRKRVVGLTHDDLTHIASIRSLVMENLSALTTSFFDYLGSLDEARPLFAHRDALEQARVLEREHFASLVSGEYGIPYVLDRLKLGLLYGRVGLETRVFFGAFHHILRNMGALIMKRNAPDAFDTFMSLKKVAFLDLGLVADTLVYERERTIRQQAEAIRELSTPVLQVRERMLLLPIIGVIDTHRAQLITENLLRSIRANRARVVVMDVTGVATIDSKVANHLLQTIDAAKLMGAKVIVTGLSAEVAQSLVVIGIDIDRFNTVGDLQGGLEDAEALLGLKVHADPDATRPVAAG
jgi:rsbT co-antagonist protein RsbR